MSSAAIFSFSFCLFFCCCCCQVLCFGLQWLQTGRLGLSTTQPWPVHRLNCCCCCCCCCFCLKLWSSRRLSSSSQALTVTIVFAWWRKLWCTAVFASLLMANTHTHTVLGSSSAVVVPFGWCNPSSSSSSIFTHSHCFWTSFPGNCWTLSSNAGRAVVFSLDVLFLHYHQQQQQQPPVALQAILLGHLCCWWVAV